MTWSCSVICRGSGLFSLVFILLRSPRAISLMDLFTRGVISCVILGLAVNLVVISVRTLSRDVSTGVGDCRRYDWIVLALMLYICMSLGMMLCVVLVRVPDSCMLIAFVGSGEVPMGGEGGSFRICLPPVSAAHVFSSRLRWEMM